MPFLINYQQVRKKCQQVKRVQSFKSLLLLLAFFVKIFLRCLELFNLVNEAVLDFISNQLHAWSVSSVLKTSVSQFDAWVLVPDRLLKVLDVDLQLSNLFLGLFKHFNMKTFRLDSSRNVSHEYMNKILTFFLCQQSSSWACSVSWIRLRIAYSVAFFCESMSDLDWAIVCWMFSLSLFEECISASDLSLLYLLCANHCCGVIVLQAQTKANYKPNSSP